MWSQQSDTPASGRRETEKRTMSTSNLYGRLCNYSTGDVIRRANRADWLAAQKLGERHTGAHRTDEFADVTIFCDGPEEDPEPWLVSMKTIADAVDASLDGAPLPDDFDEVVTRLFESEKPAALGCDDEMMWNAWDAAVCLGRRAQRLLTATKAGARVDLVSLMAAVEDDETRAELDRDIMFVLSVLPK